MYKKLKGFVNAERLTNVLNDVFHFICVVAFTAFVVVVLHHFGH